MKKTVCLLAALLLSGCTAYAHLEKINDDEFYLLQNTNVFYLLTTACDVEMQTTG